MTVFFDRPGHLRHAQIGACSYQELEGLLWRALETGSKTFVILSHNFELLNQAKDRPDNVVVERFRKLCRFLDNNRDSFTTCGFLDREPETLDRQPPPIVSPVWKTGWRMAEQVYRRRYG